MAIMNSPAPVMEVIATLSAKKSRCEIRKFTSDGETGDPVEVRCGPYSKPLGNAPKGVAINRISECRVALIIYAVHLPRMLDLSNCNGKLSISDIGNAWTIQLRKLAKIKPGSIEFVSYKMTGEQRGCYNVTIIYDANPGVKDTAFKERSARFCIATR